MHHSFRCRASTQLNQQRLLPWLSYRSSLLLGKPSTTLTWDRTYGDSSDGSFALKEEEWERRRPSPAAASLFLLENQLLSLSRLHGCSVHIVACGMPYGGSDGGPLKNMLRDAWECSPSGLPVPTARSKDGSNVVPTVHVNDLAKYVVKLAGSLVLAANPQTVQSFFQQSEGAAVNARGRSPSNGSRAQSRGSARGAAATDQSQGQVIPPPPRMSLCIDSGSSTTTAAAIVTAISSAVGNSRTYTSPSPLQTLRATVSSSSNSSSSSSAGSFLSLGEDPTLSNFVAHYLSSSARVVKPEESSMHSHASAGLTSSSSWTSRAGFASFVRSSSLASSFANSLGLGPLRI